MGNQDTPTVEEWREVVGYEGEYLVSSLGNVQSYAFTRPNGAKVKPRILKPQPGVGGGDYLRVMLYHRGQKPGKHKKIHVLVARAFLGERPHKMDTNHKDGNKLNNRADNLEYCTRSENVRHAYNHGLISRLRGENHLDAKLTEADVQEICRLHRVVGLRVFEIAEQFGVSWSSVDCVIRGKTWKHLAREF